MNLDQIRTRILTVLGTLDKISVVGFENQRKMTACADYLTETVKMLETKLVPLDEEKNHDT